MPSAKIDDPVLEDFLQRIDPVRQEIKQIVLFGSRARGDYAFDSDYDLLLVVVKKNDRLVDVLYEAVMDVLLGCGRLVSLKVFEEKEFTRLQVLHSPFMEQLGREGILLG